MTRSGTAFLLPTLAPRTGEIESGLLPTPAAVSYGTSNNGCPGDGRLEYATKGKPSLETMARKGLWPTPTEGDGKASGSRNTPSSKAHPGVSLTDAVRRDGGTGRMQFATPRAQDSKHGQQRSRAERTGEKNGDNLSAQIGGALNPTWVEGLMGFPLGWTDV